MAFLLMYLDDSAQFDPNVVENAILAVGGSRTTESYGPAVATYVYRTANDYTAILVDSDLETIKIDGTGDASLDIAWKIQAKYPSPIHLVDEGYSYDLLINEFNSVADLAARIRSS